MEDCDVKKGSKTHIKNSILPKNDIKKSYMKNFAFGNQGVSSQKFRMG